MPHPRKSKRSYRRVGFAMASLLLSLWLLQAQPVHAAGTQFSLLTWAGYDSFHVFDQVNQVWAAPTRAHARWFIPCIRNSGPDGSFDMWIGIESADGTHLIQAGIRHEKYYVPDFGTVFQFYRIWVANTRSSPTVSFVRYVNCGPDKEVEFTVSYNGVINIQYRPDNYNTTLTLGPAIWSPNWADFMVERSSSTGVLPDFGQVQFLDCQVQRVSGNQTTSLGSGPNFVQTERWDMINSSGNVLAQTSGLSSSGNFSITRLAAA